MKISKKTGILFIALSIALLLVLLFLLRGNKEQNTVKIGADFTLTGDVAWWSLELKKGMDLALEDAECQNVRIIYEDNCFKAPNAVSIFNKLTNVDRVDAIITCFSPMAEALIPLAESKHIPLVASCTSATNITKGKEWSFRDFFTQQEQCFPLAEQVYKQGFRKGVFMVINDDYGTDGINQFKAKFEDLGGEILGGEFFAQQTRSSRNEVQKVLSYKPDFIFVIARDQALITLCKQIRETNKDIQIVGINAFDSPVIWEGLGESANGVIFSSGYFNKDQNEMSRTFYNNYQARYNEEPNYNAVYGYSILKYLAKFASEAKSTEDIRKRIENMSEESVRGKLHADDLHGIVGSIGVYKRENNTTIML